MFVLFIENTLSQLKSFLPCLILHNIAFIFQSVFSLSGTLGEGLSMWD